jgi:tRNA(Ile)-lysidine synthase
VALLHVLASLGWKKLVVAHFNHGMRGRESGQDATFVRQLAKRLQLRCEVVREDIAAYANAQKLSVETAARQRRDEFFQRLCKTYRTRLVFLAHHLEDNAETILGNLCRGSGLAGVSGMAESAEFESGLVKLRPMLQVSRTEINAWLGALGLSYREDASNQSPEHRRNRLRHEVLPLLGEVFQRDVAPLLVRFGQHASREEACLDQLAHDFVIAHQLIKEDNSLKINAEFKAQHLALQLRIVRLWLTKLGLAGLGQRDYEAALSLLEVDGPAKINLPGGHWLRRKAGRLFVSSPVR